MADSRITPVELAFLAWNDALIRRDAKALLALYAPDARFESPLVSDILGIDGRVLQGRAALKFLFDRMAERQVRVNKCYRTGHLVDSKHLTWDFPDSVVGDRYPAYAEVMELDADGLIRHHTLYWPWRGVPAATPSADPRAAVPLAA